MYHFCFLGLVILLSSCATTTSKYYSEAVNSWQGGNVNTLTSRWGMPDSKTTDLDGNTIFIYKTNTYQESVRQASPPIGVHVSKDSAAIITPMPDTNNALSHGISLTCISVFVINKQGTIVSSKTQGSSCYASEETAKHLANPKQKKDLP